METGKLPKKESGVMIVKMIQGLGIRMDADWEDTRNAWQRPRRTKEHTHKMNNTNT